MSKFNTKKGREAYWSKDGKPSLRKALPPAGAVLYRRPGRSPDSIDGLGKTLRGARVAEYRGNTGKSTVSVEALAGVFAHSVPLRLSEHSVPVFGGVMAYSPKAQALRRCRAVRKDGQPCRAYAVWDDPRRLCAAHGRHHTGKMPREFDPRYKTNNPPCTCQAYAWPHRPGGGLCQWPDVPEYRYTVPAGTKSLFNGDSSFRALKRSGRRNSRRQKHLGYHLSSRGHGVPSRS